MAMLSVLVIGALADEQEKDAAALAAAHRLGFAPLFDLGGRFRAARMTRQQRKV